MALVADAVAGMRAIALGATILQLRDPGATTRHLEQEAGRLIPTAAVPVLISARCDVCLAVGAYGVHLPEADLPVADARGLLGTGRLLGRSVHSVEAARLAERQGADYVVFGPVFATGSHAGGAPRGLEALREVATALNIPVLAVGGVGAVEADSCREAGAAGFAAISHFSASA